MGATIVADGVQFRVWAPDARIIAVEIEGRPHTPLAREADGVWAGRIAGLGAGTRYRFHIDGRWGYPDPYSRSQPDGPRGPSEVIDPAAYTWHDRDWRGLTAKQIRDTLWQDAGLPRLGNPTSL